MLSYFFLRIFIFLFLFFLKNLLAFLSLSSNSCWLYLIGPQKPVTHLSHPWPFPLLPHHEWVWAALNHFQVTGNADKLEELLFVCFLQCKVICLDSKPWNHGAWLLKGVWTTQSRPVVFNPSWTLETGNNPQSSPSKHWI